MKLFSCIAIVAIVSCLVAFKPFFKKEPAAVKKVYLMRHAKASDENAQMGDFNRPLEPSGEKEAEEMGNFLSKRGEKFDLIVASPSVRTRATAKIICEKIGHEFSAIKWDSAIYACTTDALLNAIKATGRQYNKVLFIGHNNSMTHVANALQDEEKIADMPTCGVVAVAFPDSTWSTIGKGKLIFYKTPK